MNPNRPNNCCSGRQPVRPVNVAGSPCCNNAVPVQTFSCGNNAVNGGIIFGGCADAACNKETTLRDFPIAMAYVPWQDYGNVYALQQAIQRGTMFRELDLDFAGRRCN